MGTIHSGCMEMRTECMKKIIRLSVAVDYAVFYSVNGYIFEIILSVYVYTLAICYIGAYLNVLSICSIYY